MLYMRIAVATASGRWSDFVACFNRFLRSSPKSQHRCWMSFQLLTKVTRAPQHTRTSTYSPLLFIHPPFTTKNPYNQLLSIYWCNTQTSKTSPTYINKRSEEHPREEIKNLSQTLTLGGGEHTHRACRALTKSVTDKNAAFCSCPLQIS